MRFSFLSPALALGALLTAAPAFAGSTEPNGTVIPLDSMNGEIQLYTFFASVGEPIDWKLDAGTKPDTFSPLCGFTAKYVLNQAGFHFGLAWYNSTNSPPTAADLHLIMPPNSPVGTLILSSDIKNDPSYLGGPIGFALVGGQTHYSEQKWDPVCTGCNPPAPWISALIYASKKTPNAYYLAFEDGNFTPNAFGNDGDFNDDVFFLTGITCLGGGQPCDTGKPGICGPGLTQCTAMGVTCQQLNQPAPKETCNGLDDDCNGMVDEGNICPVGFICDKGSCVQSCQGGEFTCPPSLICSADGHCIDPACANVSCPSGQVCVGGICKGPCDGVACPYPEVCRVGACVDPCAAVKCDQSQVCDQGVCVARCDCAPCPMGKACDKNLGSCVDPGCAGMMCAAGQHCASGACVDDCAGAVCPGGQICQTGMCVPDPNASSSSGVGGSTGVFGAGAGGGASGTMGAGGMNSGAHSASSGGGKNPGSTGGCSCRTGADEQASRGLLGAGVLALLLASRRRRRGSP